MMRALTERRMNLNESLVPADLPHRLSLSQDRQRDKILEPRQKPPEQRLRGWICPHTVATSRSRHSESGVGSTCRLCASWE
jgi:hypothetical protein